VNSSSEKLPFATNLGLGWGGGGGRGGLYSGAGAGLEERERTGLLVGDEAMDEHPDGVKSACESRVM
jgi:hypothetical protein